jgi:trimeric autotransporter adhesin
MPVIPSRFFYYLLLTFAFLLTQQSGNAQLLPDIPVPPAAPQITGRIDASDLQRLSGNRSPSARNLEDLGRVANDVPQEHILMMLKRGAAQQEALDRFMQEQYEPHSANFHKWLTPEQYGSFFGPSTADLNRISGWLAEQGFTVNRIAAGRTFIDFSGTAGQIEAAFHTEIHRYRSNGDEHLANAGDPMIPAALAKVVSGFRALNDFHPRPLAHQPAIARLNRTTGRWSRATQGHFTSDYGAGTDYIVSPQDFAQIYNINQVWQQSAPSGSQKLVGTGESIAVIGDTELAAGDITNFRNQFGITALGPNGSVVVDHPPSSVCASPDPSSPDLEGYIDAEWAGATAPDATINFVTCANSGVTSGTDLAASYVVQDPTHAKQDAVLSSSYGYCEQDPQSESNQFYVQLWQQAAAEGITVVVATGDAGGAECDEPISFTYVSHGLSVSGEASTPYNIAAGGTDFSDVFSGTAAQYWSATNSATLQSAKSYIPETPWNEGCGSPLVLQGFNKENNTNFQTSWGANGLCTYASTLPPDFFLISPTFTRSAGSGGLSTVSTRPGWQSGVTGLPSGNARALPDISMFASSGLTWGHSLLFCYSGTGSGCDFSDPNTVFADTDGGTSFVAPAFSGIMALINQKTGDRQGQANNVLYPLAAQQLISGNNSTQPNLTTCAAYLGTGVLAACYFHDVSSTPNPDPATQQQTPFVMGTTGVPCTGSATAAGVFTDTSTDPASKSQNCFGYQITVTGSGTNLTTTPNYYGVLSTADNSSSPAFIATPGYDLATGLGTPDVYALVNAAQWSGIAISPSTLPQGQVGSAYSQTLTASGRVGPYTWSVVSGSLPAGVTLAASTGILSGTPTAAGISTFTIQVADAEATPATATASFSLTVAPQPARVGSDTVLASSPPVPGVGMNVTLTATVTGQGGTPTGTVTFYNGSTSIGAGSLSNGVATLTTSFASAGTVTLTAVYGGDANFIGSTSAPLTETVATPGFTASVNPTSITVPFANPGTVSITVTPQGGFAGPVNFACGALPAYFSCSFASSSVSFNASGAAVTNKLTINTALTTTASAGSSGELGRRMAMLFWLPAFAGLLGRRSRWIRRISFCGAVGFGLLVAINGCGGRGDHQAPDGVYSVPINLTASGAASQTVTVAVSVQ